MIGTSRTLRRFKTFARFGVTRRSFLLLWLPAGLVGAGLLVPLVYLVLRAASGAEGLAAVVFRPENAPTHGDDWIRVVGAEGVLEATSKAVKLINPGNDGTKPVAVSVDRKPFADFLRYAGGADDALIDTRATLDVTEACLLARQAADEKRIILFQ